MFIKSVIIKNYRNLRDTTLYFNNKAVAISGNNRIGKTNTLNAIMWCLCGVDIKNNSQDIKNVPFDLLGAEGQDVVDVSVYFDSFSVRRIITLRNNSCKQTLYIDGFSFEKINDAEIELDKRLGILDLSLQNTKNFNVRRFLLNPLYITYIKESDLREWIIKLTYRKHEIVKSALEEMPELLQKQLTDLLELANNDLEKVSALASKELKTKKKVLDDLTVIQQYKDIYYYALACEFYNDKQKAFNDLVEAKTLSVSVDNIIERCERKVDELNLFPSVNVKLFEKGQGEDVWKSVCQVSDKENLDSNIWNGSTSEKILLCCKLLNDYCDRELPILLDEFETIDDISKDLLLKDVSTKQVIATKVKNGIANINVNCL